MIWCEPTSSHLQKRKTAASSLCKQDPLGLRLRFFFKRKLNVYFVIFFACLHSNVIYNTPSRFISTTKNTALIAAASCGRVKVLRLLLDRGADLGVLTRCGKSCLETAIANGHQEVCMEIIKHER